MPNATSTAVQTYQLPGAAVFPESIGMDPRNGDAYVGSLADGTLYRLPVGGAVEVWSTAGRDGRASVAGVKIDARGRLFAAGGDTGSLWIYDLRDRALLARLDVGAQPSCVNDIAFGPGGEAYVTASLLSLLFRVDGDPPRLEPWVDLAEQGVQWADGLNLNGIALTRDRRHLVACQTNLGRYWRVALATGQVDEVALDGGPLVHSDGLARSGASLYAAINASDRIAVIDLAADGARGRVRRMLAGDAFAFPTAIAVRDRRLLIVNGQLDRMRSAPRLPFTVVEIPEPEAARA